MGLQNASHAGYPILQLDIGDGLAGTGDSTVINNRRARAMPGFHMAVHRIIAAINLATGKPFIKRRVAIFQHLFRGAYPMHILGYFVPETSRISKS